MSTDETSTEVTELENQTEIAVEDTLEESVDDTVDDTIAASETSPSETTPVRASAPGEAAPLWRPINARQRRLLGVMMEKAKTTPDAYPLSMAGLVTGANQKSNRFPLMSLSQEQCEDEINEMRRIGAAAEIQGAGRVPKYRHYGHTWLGVKGAEAAVLIELLLRGQQTVGDLRTRASRFEPIADLNALQPILASLMEKKLIIALTPPGRGQLITHNLYLPEELENLRAKIAAGGDDEGAPSPSSSRPSVSSQLAAAQQEIVQLKAEVEQLRGELEKYKSA